MRQNLVEQQAVAVTVCLELSKALKQAIDATRSKHLLVLIL